MRGVAHRQQDDDEASPAPRDFTAEAGALLEGVAALLPVLEARADDRAVMETVILGLRIAELASALEEDAATREDAAAGEAVVAAAYAQGLVDGEAAARQARAPGPRHAGRKRYLSAVPGIPATATRTAAVAAVVALTAGGVAAGMHDESSVRAFAAAPARHAALHRMVPDEAAVIPRPSWSPSPRPSAAMASASPAPVVTPSVPASSSPPAPAPSASPPPPVTVPAGPVLVAPGLLDLGGSHFGQLPLSVEGPGEIAWTATATDGITLVPSAGVVVSGQPVEIRVDDPTGAGGWVYFWAGSQALAVQVTSSLDAPALAVP